MRKRNIVYLTALLFGILIWPGNAHSQYRVIVQFHAEEARQGIAVDDGYIYVVHSQRIGKYDKKSNRRVAFWKGEEDGPIIHLDSGVIVHGKLYCAHSNYPKLPMTSSIEVWDAQTLQHIESHSFGINRGSCTWVDRFNGYWWAAFAHYDKWKTETGKGTEWTSVVKLNDQWIELESWTIPDTVVQLMRPYSNSGGSWGPDGCLYVTGHDLPEVYALKIPEMGSSLELVNIFEVPFLGQGIAWDRTEKYFLYGIKKKDKEVIGIQLNKED